MTESVDAVGSSDLTVLRRHGERIKVLAQNRPTWW